ncbi:MAG TPA: cytochrome P450 [Ktedonobacteraceae bacterium]
MSTTHITTHLPGQKTFHFLKGVPLLGNLPDFTRDRLGLFQRMARTADVCGIHFGPFPGILFNKPEHVHSIMVEHAYAFDKGSAVHNIVRPAIGDGIVSSEGDFHRRQRKLMAPAFQPRQIASYAEIISHYGELTQQNWADGMVIDINQHMSNITMSVIGKTLFGADVFTSTGELGAAMLTTFEYVSHAFSLPFQLPYSWPLPRHRRMRKAAALLRSYMRHFIEERRAHPGAHNDFLALLLEASDDEGQQMSDEQVMAECLTLFGAGYETTAAALSWAWYLLCKHPEMYQKVRHEVDSVLQGRTPTYADLEQLPYCLQVLKEAIRLYPPAYATCRRALDDIEIDGYCVPRGWAVLLVPYTLHRREDAFPQPERFDPERFAPAREKQLPRYAYVPFGAGPRVCLGLHFSLLEGHLLLATLAQRVSFSLVPGQIMNPDLVDHLVLRPAGTLYATITRR